MASKRVGNCQHRRQSRSTLGAVVLGCVVIGWGTWARGAASNGNAEARPAGDPVGACCTDGECFVGPQTQCPGTFLGAGTACQAPEACCIDGPNGSFCIDTDPRCCAALGGTRQGAGTSCVGDSDGNGIDDACRRCIPDAGGQRCVSADCAGARTDEACQATCVEFDPASGRTRVVECTCQSVDVCWAVVPTDGSPPFCGGSCLTTDEVCTAETERLADGRIRLCCGCQTPQLEACCFPAEGCADLTAADCLTNNGAPLGPGTACLGDNNNNGTDDACELDEPCEECGPGPHWIDECAAGQDRMPSGALIGLDRDLDPDCTPDTNLILSGPVTVRRSDPLDDSSHFPGTSPVDGHLDVLDTEMVSLHLTGSGVIMRAGAGLGGGGVLPATLGAIVEDTSDAGRADSFFDIWVEVELDGGQSVYNHEPLRVKTTIDCVPPDRTYIHPQGCVDLFDSPFPGTGQLVARLVTADHSTFPECGDPTTGDCLSANRTPFCDDKACCEAICDFDPFCCEGTWDDVCAERAAGICGPQACCLAGGDCAILTIDECADRQGVPMGPFTDCLGDGNNNGRDDACDADVPCEHCGPGPHWIDECTAGVDIMPSGALVGISTDGDCIPDTNLVLSGPARVRRSPALDISINLPGIGMPDGHLDVIDTEMESLVLSGGGVTLTAGEGLGNGGVLGRSIGTILEQPADASVGDSVFGILFEVDLGGGQLAYNHMPLPVTAKIDCIPPDTVYIHPRGCFDLFDSPEPGTGNIIAKLVTANHSTFPECGDPATGDCFRPNGTPYCDDAECCRRVCEIEPDCCLFGWSEACADLAVEVCPRTQACCLAEGACQDLPADQCREQGGLPRGEGTACEGDQNGNGRDDACDADEPCEHCGPGPHWVDECPAGSDIMPSSALVGISTDGDCIPDTNLVLSGPAVIGRSGPLDDSLQFPGIAPTDGHLEIIDTEMISLNLTGNGVTLIAGAGLGNGGVLPPTLGAIVEQSADPALADSFFGVMFEVDLGGGLLAYNHTPLEVKTEIDCLPPDAIYMHPRGCFDLFDSPEPGTGNVVAKLVTADHSTFPVCGDPTTGDCFRANGTPYCDNVDCCTRVCEFEPRCCTESWAPVCADLALELCPRPQACCLSDGLCDDLAPQKCREQGGVPLGEGTACLGDNDGNGRDDVCDADDPCEGCGPGPHWIDQCPAGADVLPSGALVGVDLDLDENCEPDVHLVFNGYALVERSVPLDDSGHFPGVAPVDGHLEVADTEILLMHLTGASGNLIAGTLGSALLLPSVGTVVEQPSDPGLADSFFDVLFEVDLGGGTLAYNHEPLRLRSKIDCVPPDTIFLAPTSCIDLFDTPEPGAGQVVARLVRAENSTSPDCGDPTAGDCFAPNGTPYCDNSECCNRVCELEPRCCTEGWARACVDLAVEVCPRPQACCFSEGRCDDLPPLKCREQSGVPLGEGTACLGDNDGNGRDDACDADGPCEGCGPGPHWIDQCPAGADVLPSGALVGVDLDLDPNCEPDVTLVFNGRALVERSAPLDDSGQFPGSAPVDGHLDVVDTEILSMDLTGASGRLIAGTQASGGILQPSLGAVVEQPSDPALGNSFFDIYVELDVPQSSTGGVMRAYNHEALRLTSKIDCVPPDTIFLAPTTCIDLFDRPEPGTGDVVARLVRAENSTSPKCGDPATGDCFAPNGTPYCHDETCCRRVCELEPDCCEVGWTEACVSLARENCVPRGACCFGDSCTELTRKECANQGGSYVGDGTVCGAVGSCCFGLDGCREVHRACCAAMGGSFFPGECQAPQACCLPLGVPGGTCGCVEIEPRCCLDLGGDPLGPDSSCANNACGRGPFIVHRRGRPDQTRPCTGYMDPRIESDNGVDLNKGVQQLVIVFSEPVFSPGGGPVGTGDFIVTETGNANPPTVASVSTTDGIEFAIRLSRIITLQEWTTIQAVVVDGCGNRIVNVGNLGPGEREPDRVDLGFLPGNINQDPQVTPQDLIHLRQFLVAGSFHNDCADIWFFDIDRDGVMPEPQDLLRFRQMIAGTPPATRAWPLATMNSPQP